MKRFRLSIGRNLFITIVVSVSVWLFICFASPPLLTQGRPQAELFEQVWKTVDRNFYDPKFNGIDWKAMGEKYQPLAAEAKSSEEFAVVVNQMLSELKTSHTRFYTQNEPEYYQLLGIFYGRNTDLKKELKQFFPKGKIEYSGIGAFTKNIDGKIFVRAILDGSPAAKAGLKVGDRLLDVDGRPYQAIESFAGKAGQTVKLSIQRTPNPNSREEIALTPEIFDAATMFLDAQKASRETVERDGKKIGYVHIWSYAGEQYQEQLEDDLIDGPFKDVDGLVLDLRDGWGGASPSYLNIFTAKIPDMTIIRRNGRRITRNFQWKKPVVMLVNEGTRSGKEILAFGFQQYQIGPVVGSKTAGAVVGGSPFLMQDGSIVYLAVVDVFVNEKYRLEGEGITPDIGIPFSLEYAQGADPQKQRAIEVAATFKKSAFESRSSR